MVRQIFNEIIKQNEFTREAWKKVKNQSDIQKGDVRKVGNHRPICSLPALYKLFTTILYSRLYPRLDQKQAEDQAGFRSSYQTTDHLATYRMIEQKCHEWGIKMWTATIDFTKAFDSITHKSIWNAVKSCGIEHDYISLLKKLCRDQKASVLTDKKGTKQGDPLSSLLFNMVLQKALEDDIPRWQKKKGMRIYLSDNDHDCLTNLRIADDVLLFASPKEQVQNMLCALQRSTEKVVSAVIQKRRKFSATKARTQKKKLIEVDDRKIEILTRGESVRCLGQTITFLQQETTEIKNRIRAAWATFHKHRQELTWKNYLLKHRLRLFDAVITPTIFYASGTRTPTKEHERMIQSTQRKMLRLIVQTKRRYKKIVKQKDKTNEEKNINDISEDGQSSNTHKDQDSDVSFEKDTEEGIDTTEIEEEDGIEYMKKKHKRCHRKDGKCTKNEMETGAEKSNITE